jgi:hypothetical protein
MIHCPFKGYSYTGLRGISLRFIAIFKKLDIHKSARIIAGNVPPTRNVVVRACIGSVARLRATRLLHRGESGTILQVGKREGRVPVSTSAGAMRAMTLEELTMRIWQAASVDSREEGGVIE